LKCPEHLDHLAANISFSRFQCSCYLHGDGTGAAGAFHSENVLEGCTDHCNGIYPGVIIKVFVFFRNDRFPQQGRYFVQLRFHSPFLVFGQVGINNFSVLIGYDR
jgi:hypothetical protein